MSSKKNTKNKQKGNGRILEEMMATPTATPPPPSTLDSPNTPTPLEESDLSSSPISSKEMKIYYKLMTDYDTINNKTIILYTNRNDEQNSKIGIKTGNFTTVEFKFVHRFEIPQPSDKPDKMVIYYKYYPGANNNTTIILYTNPRDEKNSKIGETSGNFDNLKFVDVNSVPSFGGSRKPLSKCTVAELKAKAKSRKMKGYSTMTKAELLNLLKRKK